MQIRYQNVQKNITYMSVSFAFMKKVLESAHLSFSSYATTMNSNIRDKGLPLYEDLLAGFVSGHRVLHDSAIFVLYD